MEISHKTFRPSPTRAVTQRESAVKWMVTLRAVYCTHRLVFHSIPLPRGAYQSNPCRADSGILVFHILLLGGQFFQPSRLLRGKLSSQTAGFMQYLQQGKPTIPIPYFNAVSMVVSWPFSISHREGNSSNPLAPYIASNEGIKTTLLPPT
jgi:hypothetical protein